MDDAFPCTCVFECLIFFRWGLAHAQTYFLEVELSVHITESGYLKEGKSTVFSSGLKGFQLSGFCHII